MRRNWIDPKSIIKKRVGLFTIINGKEGKTKMGPYETYLVAADQLKTDTKSKEFQIGLERLSKIITISQQKGKTDSKYAPTKIKSIHNDLTQNTIRGLIKPDVYWELHYDISKDGRVVLQRVCEFDHASKFVW